MSGYALEVNDLAIGWNGQPLIESMDFCLPAQKTLAIVGESGCGKSTLLATLAGLKRPLAGSVQWHGGDRQRPRVAMVWQNLALFAWKRVRENLALPLQLAGQTQIDSQVERMICELELQGLERKFPHELSGGQRQRLALGRALIGRPDILFMDEPFSALDAILREHMQDFLKQLWLRHACSVIFVTHDIAEAVYLGSSIALLGARPSRLVACAANPAFEPQLRRNVRESDSYYAVQRRLHAALGAVRSGQTVQIREGQW